MATESFAITKELENKLRMASIPQTVSDSMFSRNQEKANEDNLEPCPCCGKGIKEENRRFYINSAFGGCMYIPIDNTVYNDTWEMPVGATCVKKINPDYVFKYED